MVISSERVLLPYEITLLSNGQVRLCVLLWFYYLMKLHYSQTDKEAPVPSTVLLPYEITLLSNESAVFVDAVRVLLPYEITLLSNRI